MAGTTRIAVQPSLRAVPDALLLLLDEDLYLSAAPGPGVRPWVPFVHLPRRADPRHLTGFLPPGEPIREAVINHPRRYLVRVEEDPGDGLGGELLDPDATCGLRRPLDLEGRLPTTQSVGLAGVRSVELQEEPAASADLVLPRPRDELQELLSKVVLPPRADVQEGRHRRAGDAFELEIDDQGTDPGGDRPERIYRFSRRVVRLVVRLRRQALPLADLPDDVGLQVCRHGLEPDVLRRPECAARGRRPDRGREPEHLRHGRLRDDDRVVPLLGDVLDHAPPGLDFADRGAHHVLRDVHEHLREGLQEGPPRLAHRPVDRAVRRGDHLRGAAVDRVLVELRVHEPHLHRHALLPGEWALPHRLLDERLLDQLHRLVEVLDPLRRVDQHVRVLDPHDVLRLVLRHPELLELLREDLRVLDPLPRRDLSGADRIDDRLLEGLHLEIEAMVFVRGLPLEGAALPPHAFPVHDDRRARDHGDLVVVLDPVDRDLEVELPHPGDQVLPGLLVDLDLDARVCLSDRPERVDELRQVLRGLRLDRHRDDRVGVMDDRLERLHVLVVAHRRARDRVVQSDDGDHVPAVDLVDGDPVRAHDHRDDLRTRGLRAPDDPQLLPPPDL